MEAVISFDFQNCFIFILIFLLTFICFFFFFKKPKDSRVNFDLPPSPPSLPIIGHVHLLLSTLTHKSLQKLSSRTQDVNISSRGVTAVDESLVFGSSSFVTAPYGDYWKFMKKLTVMKLLGPQAQEQSRDIRADDIKRFCRNLLDKARKKESVEIGKEAMNLMNNILCKMSMGRSFSEENVLLRRQLQKLGISLFKKDIMGVSNKFDVLLEKVLVEHREKPEKDQGTVMLDVLLAAYGDENAEYKITKNHIKAFFVDLFIGATDTSVQTIQWTMAEIMNNTHILERMREEIDSVVGKSRLIQETDLPNLPYLHAVIKEALRLHPPGPLLPREFQQGCKIGGFYIPEKTTLLINAYVVMRDPNVWEDPEEFKPERFLASSRSGQEDERREQALKFLPFGSGRRGCPGSNLAYMIVGSAIGMMVQCFDWRIEGEKVNMKEDVKGTILTMAHPLKLTPVTRQPPLTWI
ncbi:unnamed protein product [Arabidopsis thaliana]|uniref:(thale cress) hypothetical protein n=1 Tax=Arabidopsis thaliana TaxID=3702 RepID=A0A7G2EQJ1_ARATH|nr:unnamed protein product [Arabidopsis thaliana]